VSSEYRLARGAAALPLQLGRDPGAGLAGSSEPGAVGTGGQNPGPPQALAGCTGAEQMPPRGRPEASLVFI